VFVNLLLRPIVSFINRQPLVSTELEVGYVVSITCRSPDEAHIRALLWLATSGLALRHLDSSDLNGSARVVVTAFVRAHQRVDDEVEKIVGRLSLEPTGSAARWQAVADVDPWTTLPFDCSHTAGRSRFGSQAGRIEGEACRREEGVPGAREASCADFGVGVWGFNPKPE